MTVEEIKKIGYGIPILFSIILLAVISVIVVVTFQEVKPTQENIIITNESVTLSGLSVILASGNSHGNFLTMDNSSLIICNGTNNTINSNNYYPFPNGSLIFKVGATKFTDVSANISYDYNIEASSYYYNITRTGGNTFQNITKQMPLFGTIIILIAIALIALGIFAFFGGKKKPI